MSDLQSLYQEVILDHSRNPRHFGKPQQWTHHIRGQNPLCGDEIDLYVTLDEEKQVIRSIHFDGQGCSISIASASFMAEHLSGKSRTEALTWIQRFFQMVKTPFTEPLNEEEYGDLIVFGGVRAFPSRVKCATLAWHALESVLKGEGKEVITTE